MIRLALNKTRHRTRQAALIGSVAVAFFSITACAQTQGDSAALPTTVSNAEAGNQSLETTGESPASEAMSKNEGQIMTDTDNTYWVKKPGTLVYNGLNQVVRSLRFQPKVTIYSENGEWGRIDPQKDEWVKLSDITLEQPAGVLAGPEYDNGRPKVTLERPN